MSLTRIRLLVPALLLILVISGCASGTTHIKVNANGSIDLMASLRLDARAESVVGEAIEDKLFSTLQDAGIQLEKLEEEKSVEYKFTKSYASFAEIGSFSGNWDIVDAQIMKTGNWFYTKYEVDVQPKWDNYTDSIMENMDSLNVPKPLLRMLMQNVAFDLQLTLPLDLFGDNNATADDGRTLTWHISLTEPEPLQLAVYVPDVKHIVISLVILAALIIIAIILWVRKRRKKQ